MERVIFLFLKKSYNIRQKGDLLMKGTFNVEKPTRENIDYAFKNLMFYVVASTR